MPECQLKESSYRFHRNEDGTITAFLKCQECGQEFEVDASDSMFAVLIVNIAPRFDCGKHESENKL